MTYVIFIGACNVHGDDQEEQQIMSERSNSLSSKNILVVEDEYFLATDLSSVIQEMDGQVVGPVGTLSEALELARTANIDLAVLDINLHGEMAYDLVDDLLVRDIPVILATGYGTEGLPERFARCQVVQKPYPVEQLLRDMRRQLRSHDERPTTG